MIKNTTTMADSENIDITILKCNEREQILSKQVLKFYEDSEFFDIILVAGKDCVNIKAHRVVLCAFSGYFLEVFREKQSQNDDQKLVPDNIIELKEFEASTLKDVVEFMYTGTIELCLNTAEKFLRIAVALKIPTLITNCSGFIEERLGNVNSLNWLKIATELCLPSLKTVTLKYIHMEFENLSVAEDDFFLKMFNINDLQDLLFRENPYGDFEEDIFLAMVAWINYDNTNRESMIFELLSLVRFWKLTPKFIIENRHSVCKTMESYELICSWIEWHLSPETNLVQPKHKIIPLQERVLSDQLGFIGIENDEFVTCRFDHIKNEMSPEEKDELPSEIVKASKVKINNKLTFYDLLSKTINILDWKLLMTLCELPAMKEHSSFQLLEINGNPYAVKNGKLWSVHLVSGEWEDVADFADDAEQVWDSFAINAHNGILYVHNAIDSELYRFDVSSDEWMDKAVVCLTRENNEIIDYQSFVATEKVLYFFDENTIYRFNLLSMEWDEDISLPEINIENLKCYSYDEDVIISDGTKIEKLSADSGEWTTLAHLPPKLSTLGFSIFKFT